MGETQSRNCNQPLQNPDLLSVVTLSDSAVQRLPVEVDDNPLDVERRSQNTDDYWRERLTCMEDAFGEAKGLNEHEFTRLEYTIKNMAPGIGQLACPRVVEDVEMCYRVYYETPLTCSGVAKQLNLCMDTLMQDRAKKKYMDERRKAKSAKRKKVCPIY